MVWVNTKKAPPLCQKTPRSGAKCTKQPPKMYQNPPPPLFLGFFWYILGFLVHSGGFLVHFGGVWGTIRGVSRCNQGGLWYNSGGFKYTSGGFQYILSGQFLGFPGVSGVWEPRQGVRCILRTVSPPPPPAPSRMPRCRSACSACYWSIQADFRHGGWRGNGRSWN